MEDYQGLRWRIIHELKDSRELKDGRENAYIETICSFLNGVSAEIGVKGEVRCEWWRVSIIYLILLFRTIIVTENFIHHSSGQEEFLPSLSLDWANHVDKMTTGFLRGGG